METEDPSPRRIPGISLEERNPVVVLTRLAASQFPTHTVTVEEKPNAADSSSGEEEKFPLQNEGEEPQENTFTSQVSSADTSTDSVVLIEEWKGSLHSESAERVPEEELRSGKSTVELSPVREKELGSRMERESPDPSSDNCIQQDGRTAQKTFDSVPASEIRTATELNFDELGADQVKTSTPVPPSPTSLLCASVKESEVEFFESSVDDEHLSLQSNDEEIVVVYSNLMEREERSPEMSSLEDFPVKESKSDVKCTRITAEQFQTLVTTIQQEEDGNSTSGYELQNGEGKRIVNELAHSCEHCREKQNNERDFDNYDSESRASTTAEPMELAQYEVADNDANATAKFAKDLLGNEDTVRTNFSHNDILRLMLESGGTSRSASSKKGESPQPQSSTDDNVIPMDGPNELDSNLNSEKVYQVTPAEDSLNERCASELNSAVKEKFEIQAQDSPSLAVDSESDFRKQVQQKTGETLEWVLDQVKRLESSRVSTRIAAGQFLRFVRGRRMMRADADSMETSSPLQNGGEEPFVKEPTESEHSEVDHKNECDFDNYNSQSRASTIWEPRECETADSDTNMTTLSQELLVNGAKRNFSEMVILIEKTEAIEINSPQKQESSQPLKDGLGTCIAEADISAPQNIAEDLRNIEMKVDPPGDSHTRATQEHCTDGICMSIDDPDERKSSVQSQTVSQIAPKSLNYEKPAEEKLEILAPDSPSIVDDNRNSRIHRGVQATGDWVPVSDIRIMKSSSITEKHFNESVPPSPVVFPTSLVSADTKEESECIEGSPRDEHLPPQCSDNEPDDIPMEREDCSPEMGSLEDSPLTESQSSVRCARMTDEQIQTLVATITQEQDGDSGDEHLVNDDPTEFMQCEIKQENECSFDGHGSESRASTIILEPTEYDDAIRTHFAQESNLSDLDRPPEKRATLKSKSIEFKGDIQTEEPDSPNDDPDGNLYSENVGQVTPEKMSSNQEYAEELNLILKQEFEVENRMESADSQTAKDACSKYEEQAAGTMQCSSDNEQNVDELDTKEMKPPSPVVPSSENGASKTKPSSDASETKADVMKYLSVCAEYEKREIIELLVYISKYPLNKKFSLFCATEGSDGENHQQPKLLRDSQKPATAKTQSKILNLDSENISPAPKRQGTHVELEAALNNVVRKRKKARVEPEKAPSVSSTERKLRGTHNELEAALDVNERKRQRTRVEPKAVPSPSPRKHHRSRIEPETFPSTPPRYRQRKYFDSRTDPGPTLLSERKRHRMYIEPKTDPGPTFTGRKRPRIHVEPDEPETDPRPAFTKRIRQRIYVEPDEPRAIPIRVNTPRKRPRVTVAERFLASSNVEPHRNAKDARSYLNLLRSNTKCGRALSQMYWEKNHPSSDEEKKKKPSQMYWEKKRRSSDEEKKKKPSQMYWGKKRRSSDEEKKKKVGLENYKRKRAAHDPYERKSSRMKYKGRLSSRDSPLSTSDFYNESTTLSSSENGSFSPVSRLHGSSNIEDTLSRPAASPEHCPISEEAILSIVESIKASFIRQQPQLFDEPQPSTSAHIPPCRPDRSKYGFPSSVVKKRFFSPASTSRSISPASYDPRTPPVQRIEKLTFSARVGRGVDRDLYKSVGKEYIDKFWELILHWNADWMRTHDETGECPPICEFYPTIKLSYRDELHYYNTYVPLHLLNVWYRIFDCWKNRKGLQIHCTCDELKEKSTYVKVTFSTVLKATDSFPRRKDIALCSMTRPGGDVEEVLLLIKTVLVKDYGDRGLTKLEIKCRSAVSLSVSYGDSISMHILGNVRIALLQNVAFKTPHPFVRELLLKPERHTYGIEVVRIHRDRPVQQVGNDIVSASMLSQVCLVDVTAMPDTVLLLSQLAYVFLKNSYSKNKILVVLKNEEFFPKLVKRLIEYEPVLAVRSQEMSINESMTRLTPEHRTSIGESKEDIVNSSSLFITTFSSFDAKDLLFKDRVTCIVEDAHMCTEADTILPLTLNLKRLILLGKPKRCPGLPPLLQRRGYDISLFMRLLLVKTS